MILCHIVIHLVYKRIMLLFSDPETRSTGPPVEVGITMFVSSVSSISEVDMVSQQPVAFSFAVVLTIAYITVLT